MLTAEKVVKKYHKGFHRREWVKVRPRNEALDCRVYALAALSIVGVNVNIIAQKSMANKAQSDEPTEPAHLKSDANASSAGRVCSRLAIENRIVANLFDSANAPEGVRKV